MATLVQKLGIKPGNAVLLLDAPEEVARRLHAEAPEGVAWQSVEGEEPPDIVVFWPLDEEGLAARFRALQALIEPHGAVWGVVPKKKFVGRDGRHVAWPAMQAAALTTDLVDNKIASVDETTYATRFVVRRERRSAGGAR